MKKIFIKVVLVVWTLPSLFSCEGLLTENPNYSFTDKQVFRTEAGIETAVVGVYSGLRHSSLWQANMFEWLNYASGIFHWRGDRRGDTNFVTLFEQAFGPNYAQNNAIDRLYVVMGRCNTVLQKIEASPVSDDFKREIKGEMYLLRAIMYFTLVRMYGDVPLVTFLPKTVEEAAIPRTASDEIYKQIIEDLTNAFAMMRGEERQAEATGTTGRPHKWAAKAFLAKVYVQIGSIMSYPDDQPSSFTGLDFSICGIGSAQQAWELALATAEEVIADSPYRLEGDYARLFRWTAPEDFLLKERIFTMQSTETGIYSNQFTAWRTLPNYVVGSAEGANVATNNGNYGRVRPSRFFFQKWAGAHGGTTPSEPRADGFQDIYTGCPDPRFDISMFHTSFQIYNGGNKSRITDLVVYPSDGEVGYISLNDIRPQQSQPYLKKYLNPKFNGNTGYADFYMLRLADIYLLAAEAAAELSDAPGDAMWLKAFEHVETIHGRARRSVSPAAEYPKWTASQFATKQQLVDALMFERFYELLGEGHEWFDIRRKGTEFMIRNLNKPLNDFNLLATEGPTVRTGSGGTIEYDGFYSLMYMNYVYSEDEAAVRNRLLCALPETFLLVNPAITEQNPGW